SSISASWFDRRVPWRFFVRSSPGPRPAPAAPAAVPPPPARWGASSSNLLGKDVMGRTMQRNTRSNNGPGGSCLSNGRELSFRGDAADRTSSPAGTALGSYGSRKRYRRPRSGYSASFGVTTYAMQQRDELRKDLAGLVERDHSATSAAAHRRPQLAFKLTVAPHAARKEWQV